MYAPVKVNIMKAKNTSLLKVNIWYTWISNIVDAVVSFTLISGSNFDFKEHFFILLELISLLRAHVKNIAVYNNGFVHEIKRGYEHIYNFRKASLQNKNDKKYFIIVHIGSQFRVSVTYNYSESEENKEILW